MALIYFQKMLQVLTSHTSKLPKKVLKNTKNMTPNSCSVRPEKFHPYIFYVVLDVFFEVLTFFSEEAEVESEPCYSSDFARFPSIFVFHDIVIPLSWVS